MSYIDIENMEFYAHHGCFEEEQQIGTHFRVSVKMRVGTEKAQKTDCIDDTVNYLLVYQEVKREMETPSKLLENVADRIGTAILQKFQSVSFVQTKVSKLNPPLGGEIKAVSVTVNKFRDII